MGAYSRDMLTALVVGAVLLALPFLLGNDYYVTVLIICAINGLIVVGLNLLLGYAGQISLGHAAFFGLAAYTSSIVTSTLQLPMGAGIAAGIALPALVALLIGIPTLKLTGYYLAMATLGFGIIVYIFFNETIALTGGPSGFDGLIPRLSLFGYEFESDLSYYYLVTCVLVLGVMLAVGVVHSKTGRALKAIHTSEKAAQCMGVDVARHKLFTFVLSAVYAAVAGVLYAHYLTFIAPSSFGFMFSVELIVMVVLGGMGSLWGSVAGAYFLTMLPEFLRAFEDIEVILFGSILVACMIFMPQGFAGGLKALMHRVRAPKDGEVAEDGS